MAKFTISEKDASLQSKKIYPSDSGCTQDWTPSSGLAQDCVAENDEYISMSTDDKRIAVFELDKVEDLGEINNVNLHVNARSVGASISDDGYFNLHLANSDCTSNVTYSIDIGESYYNRKVILKTDPLTNESWEWESLCSYNFGIEGSSPTKEVELSVSIFPDSDVDLLLTDYQYSPALSSRYQIISEDPFNPSRYAYKTSFAGFLSGIDRDTGHDVSIVSDNTNNVIYANQKSYTDVYEFNGTFNLLDSVYHSSSYSAGEWGTGCDSLTMTDDGYPLRCKQFDDYGIFAYGMKYDSDIKEIQSIATLGGELAPGTSGGNYVADGCNDDNYHYIIRAYGPCQVYSIKYPNASNEIEIKDKEEFIPIGGTFQSRSCGICTNGSGRVFCQYGTGNTLVIESLSVDGSGNFTVNDTMNLMSTAGISYINHTTQIRCYQNLLFMFAYCRKPGESTSSKYAIILKYNSGTGTLSFVRMRELQSEEGFSVYCKPSFLYKNFVFHGYEGRLRRWEIDTTEEDLIYSGAHIINEDDEGTGSFGYSINGVGIGDRIFVNAKGDKLLAYHIDNFYDVFGFEDAGITSGSISRVDLSFVASNLGGDDCTYRTHLFQDSSHVSQDTIHSTGVNNIFSHSYYSTPSGGSWDWDSLSEVTGGVEIIPNSNPASDEHRKLIQLYLRAYYTLIGSPEIRVKKLYIEVFYFPYENSVELNVPEEISSDHKRNTRILNFWNGTREVYDVNRREKSLLLRGREYSPNQDAWDEFTKLREIGKRGSTVEINDLSINYFNGEYKIRSFNYRVISERPMTYEWAIELEDVNL
jgi:hypothetical protein